MKTWNSTGKHFSSISISSSNWLELCSFSCCKRFSKCFWSSLVKTKHWLRSC